MERVPDKSVLQKVNQRVSRAGGNSVRVSVVRGDVTLAGTLQYEIQRSAIVRAATSVAGVRRVTDQLVLQPKKKR